MINIEDDILLNMGLIVVTIIKREISVSQLELKEQIEIICCLFYCVMFVIKKGRRPFSNWLVSTEASRKRFLGPR